MYRLNRGGKEVLGKRVVISIFILLVLFFGYQTAFTNGASPLVETQWLADNLKNPDIRIIYVAGMSSDDKTNFDSKHIPGSTYVGIGTLMGVLGSGSTPPDRAKFEALMGELGINKGNHVVIYGSGGGNPFITTLFWLMDYSGHKKVSYLNGGFAKWSQENRKTAGEATKIIPTTYKAESGNESIRADADYVVKNLKNPKVAIVDARGTDAFSGKVNEVETNKRVGHIPGAIDLMFITTNLNSDGTFKSVGDLKAVYESKGVTKDKGIITYCQGGVRATHTYFVLKHLLGHPNVRNYVGSWSEWSNLDPVKYPVEK